MAKRFINPNWKQLRLLPDYLQRCWFYIWDKADESGVYEIDLEYLKIDLNLKNELHVTDFSKLPDCKILNGEKVLITNFLIVNNGGILKKDYNPHKPIFRAIEKNGAEIFEELDIFIETGVKEKKEIQAIKLFFKLENKKFKLVGEDEGVGEDKDEKEKGVQGEKQIPLGQAMYALFQKTNPTYPPRPSHDIAAIVEISGFVNTQSGGEGDMFHFTAHEEENVLHEWGRWCDWYKANGNNKPLDYLVKFKLQEIYSEIKNGKQNGSFNKPGNQSTSKRYQPTGEGGY